MDNMLPCDGKHLCDKASSAITCLLLVKSVLTALSGLPVLLRARSLLDDLGFPVITEAHVHMTTMWGVWMCCFQALLEATFALHVCGMSRNLFVLIEGVFEIALLVEVAADRRTADAARYSAPIEVVYALTVLLFFSTLLLAPDVVADPGRQRRAARFAGVASAVMLFAVACSL